MRANPSNGVCRHEFICGAAQAKAVYLVGDFNGWNPRATPMAGRGNGLWSVTLALPAGPYHYEFVCDGHWYADADCIPAAESTARPNFILTQHWIG